MEENKNNKNKWLHLRMDEASYHAVQNNFRKSTEKNFSAYLRKVLLEKPVFAGVKDTGLSEILAELHRLQKDMNKIGNNYNQMVHKLHLCDKDPEVKLWVLQYNKERGILLEALESLTDTSIKLPKNGCNNQLGKFLATCFSI
ncbi:plasmid mobilization relaxosome protein MobC [Sphingobacterium sp. KU25419]|nr:plasmid mobilization relaxosome protein MobC [Sphingobacterium sp. KU25419]